MLACGCLKNLTWPVCTKCQHMGSDVILLAGVTFIGQRDDVNELPFFFFRCETTEVYKFLENEILVGVPEKISFTVISFKFYTYLNFQNNILVSLEIIGERLMDSKGLLYLYYSKSCSNRNTYVLQYLIY